METYGLGARGFNQYDGTIEEAYFEKIETVGDGSIGMQFSKPVGKITIGTAVTPHGSKGKTLVKGVIKELYADAISVVEGGEIDELDVLGDLVTRGDDVVSFHVSGGTVKKLSLGGILVADGKNVQYVLIENDGTSDTEALANYLK